MKKRDMLTFSSFDKKKIHAKQLYMWSSLVAEFQVLYKNDNMQRCIKNIKHKIVNWHVCGKVACYFSQENKSNVHHVDKPFVNWHNGNIKSLLYHLSPQASRQMSSMLEDKFRP
jgi:hypothetical protein